MKEKIILDYLGRPDRTPRVLLNNRGVGRRVGSRVRERFEDALLLALNMEEGATYKSKNASGQRNWREWSLPQSLQKEPTLPTP